jgi:hypothetical protein
LAEITIGLSRKEMERKRTILLLALIVPVLLIVFAWNVTGFSDLGSKGGSETCITGAYDCECRHSTI